MAAITHLQIEREFDRGVVNGEGKSEKRERLWWWEGSHARGGASINDVRQMFITAYRPPPLVHILKWGIHAACFCRLLWRSLMVGPFAARQIYLHYKSRDASKRVTGVCIIQSRASQGEFQIDPARVREKYLNTEITSVIYEHQFTCWGFRLFWFQVP